MIEAPGFSFVNPLLSVFLLRALFGHSGSPVYWFSRARQMLHATGVFWLFECITWLSHSRQVSYFSKS